MLCPGAHGKATSVSGSGTRRTSPTGVSPLLAAGASMCEGVAIQALVTPRPETPTESYCLVGITLHGQDEYHICLEVGRLPSKTNIARASWQLASCKARIAVPRKYNGHCVMLQFLDMFLRVAATYLHRLTPPVSHQRSLNAFVPTGNGAGAALVATPLPWPASTAW
jgi:hypothetical protein